MAVPGNPCSPYVLYGIDKHEAYFLSTLKQFLLVAGEIGQAFLKMGATISAPLGGCQAK